MPLTMLGGSLINSYNTPLYNSIKKYALSKPTAFHMPGHKLGKGIPEEFLNDLLSIDLTEISGTDNLHYPEGAIKEAQELAARAFGADRSFFLVNGSTCGIHAAILTVLSPGDKLIVARDCHKSVINGMVLAGAIPVYIQTQFERDFGIPTAVLTSDIEKAIRENPDAKGVFITRPNYYGVCCDIKKIAGIVHSYGKVLLTDEAHGAHLRFNGNLPVCAMDAEADLCIQSAHKTLPAVTQGAYMHVKGNRIDIERLKANLRMLQTSSPSYIIMAFLDIARSIMDQSGKIMLDGLLDNIDLITDRIAAETGFQMLSPKGQINWELDKTRVVINVNNIGKTGFEIDSLLRREYNIQVEMADLYNIVCICTVADKEDDFIRLGTAMSEMARRFKGMPALAQLKALALAVPPQGIPLAEIKSAKGVIFPLREAVGKISLDMLTPYPPGVPVICPGEVILEDAVEYIYDVINHGGIVNGLLDNYKVWVVG
jgi:lysine decarboxylase